MGTPAGTSRLSHGPERHADTLCLPARSFRPSIRKQYRLGKGDERLFRAVCCSTAAKK